ncbi:MAG TPA: SAM-dependent DNA methyltransferase [Gammaproteobacteria bacterium]|nr:SAM-dependent DNA methyltransferase [Gammaproteobacteria bacterium]
MHALTSEQRTRLARVILQARREGEAGARKALQALAVDKARPFEAMSEADKTLRVRLRAHGRQLGDRRDRKTGEQQIDHLAHEVAYEHWHRMLFARFLAENHLLIEPESGVAIPLKECEDLAREQGLDPWALAGRFAARMLPRIFRPDDPALEVTLAPETRQALEKLLESLPTEVFTADDALGWTYQFWQAEKKEEVNRSGEKIGADELPAVTQLFTEHYMVQFLFHNTIGAWHAGKVLAERPELAESAADEDALRRAVRLTAAGGYDFDYLRFVREPREADEEGKPTGPLRPAAGAFEGWPDTAAELKVLDPSCGSGHFLVEGLHILARLRMEEESLELIDAIRAVLADNLFGLEIDPRCTQIAAFSLALAAWKLIGKPIELPALNIACSGLPVAASRNEWLKLAGGDDQLERAMEQLHDLFRKAPELGSLIDPAALGGDLVQADFGAVRELLGRVLEREDDIDAHERAVAARGMARAAELLADRYTLVITNVPYLARGKQSETLRSFADDHHPAAKQDLATLFLSRSLRWLGEQGSTALVTPQNWLFLTSYKKLREKLLKERTWNLVARLGPRAFETIGGEVVNVALEVISADKAEPEWQMGGIDASNGQTPQEKAALLRGEGVDAGRMDGVVRLVAQQEQLKNPDARISFNDLSSSLLLADIADYGKGSTTGDGPRFLLHFWEFLAVEKHHVYWLNSPTTTEPWSGRTELCKVPLNDVELNSQLGCRLHGQNVFNRNGVVVNKMRRLEPFLYGGEAFDDNICPICPSDPKVVPASWAYVTSEEYHDAVRAVDQALKVTAATLTKVPFDQSRWEKIAAGRYPHGLPEPQSNDPTQWLFHGHPAGMVAAGPAARSPWGIADPVGTDRHPSLICREPNLKDVLQVAVARLLGYRWPAEQDADMRLDAAARAWVERCKALDEFADDDGIVALRPVRGERSAADRLRALLAAAFGDAWNSARERELLQAAAGDGKPAASLEDWLRDQFFEAHCKLFHHRPSIWHLWDGRKDGFHVLVNYHRLAAPNGEARRTLEAIAYSYLREWIERQRREQQGGTEGADARLATALDLQAQLQKILEGEPPCDIFVRWKPLHEQPIGWEPDINDGVRLNIRPFMTVELRKGGRKGAGILRWKPNIKWNKDRGKETESLRPREDFPWFWSCPGDGSLEERTDFTGRSNFDGNRWNDLHYTNTTKRAARERKAKEEES